MNARTANRISTQYKDRNLESEFDIIIKDIMGEAKKGRYSMIYRGYYGNGINMEDLDRLKHLGYQIEYLNHNAKAKISWY